ALHEAVSLYTGPLLPNLLYEDWVAERREALSHLHERALAALADIEARTDPQAARERLNRLLAANPTDEAAAEALMRLLAAGGQRVAALHVSARLARALAEELDVAPSPAIEALHASLRAAPSIPPDYTAGSPGPAVPRHNLPAALVAL